MVVANQRNSTIIINSQTSADTRSLTTLSMRNYYPKERKKRTRWNQSQYRLNSSKSSVLNCYFTRSNFHASDFRPKSPRRKTRSELRCKIAPLIRCNKICRYIFSVLPKTSKHLFPRPGVKLCAKQLHLADAIKYEGTFFLASKHFQTSFPYFQIIPKRNFSHLHNYPINKLPPIN